MRILVTGAQGFVGRHAVADLVAAGHDVATLSHPQDGRAPGPDSFVADIRDAGRVADAVRDARADACLHLAGIAFVPAGWTDPDGMFSVNVLGTLNLLEAFRRHAPRARVLVVSTAQVYGQRAGPAPFDEDAPFAPESLYAVSKLAADLNALLYAKRYDLPAMTARPCNHIGPGQSPDFVVPSFARQLAAIAAGRAEPVLRVGNLASEREFLDVRDVASAYRLLLERGCPGAAYNVATGRFVTIQDVLDLLCRLAGVRPRIEIDPARFRPTDTQPRLDTAKLARDTGWQPRFTLEQTLADVYAATRA